MISDIKPRKTYIPTRPLVAPARVRPDIYKVRRVVRGEALRPVVKDESRPIPRDIPEDKKSEPLKTSIIPKEQLVSKNTNHKTKLSFKTVAASSAVIALVGLSGFVSIDAWLTNQELKDRIAALPAVASSETITPEERRAAEGMDEEEPSQSSIDDFVVAADMPRIISINKIGVYARVLQMGINPDGSMQAPLNIYDAGWYNGSAKPGTEGAAVIDGHASGLTREGLFGHLNTLKEGDTIDIETGSGDKLSYKVLHLETVPLDKVDMRKAMTVYGDSNEGLNLITCDGPWIGDRQTMADRVIVYTERIKV